MSNPGGNFGPTTMAMGEENAQQTPPQNNPGAITRAVGEDMQGGVPSNPGGMQKMTMAIPESGQQPPMVGGINDPRNIQFQGKLPVRPDGSMVNMMTTMSPENGQLPSIPVAPGGGVMTRALGEQGNPPLPGGGQIMTMASPESGQQPPMQQPPMQRPPMFGGFNPFGGFGGYGGFGGGFGGGGFGNSFGGYGGGFNPFGGFGGMGGGYGSPFMGFGSYGGFNPFGGFGNMGGFGGGFGQQRQPINFGGGFGQQQQMAPNLTQQRFTGY